MKPIEFLNKYAYLSDGDIPGSDSKVWRSRFDGSYLTHEGTENKVSFLLKHGITDQLQSTGECVNLGFNPVEQKWYGWSHRAIFGFGIGSRVEKGDCGYTANNPEEMIDDYANFFADISQECADQHRAECQILPDRSGIRILHTPMKLPMATMKDLPEALDDLESLPVETVFADAVSVRKCGRGEWEAKTLDDAKQMAIDFAEGVS